MNIRLPMFPRRPVLGGALLLALTASGFAQTPQTLIFNGGHDDRGNAVATDSAGNIIIGGQSTSETASSFLVLKYAATGSLLWQSRASSIGEYKPSAVNSLAVDAAGNTYAAGYAGKDLPFLQTDWGWLVTSFDANGVQRWSQLFNGPDRSFDVARRLVLHPQQGLYVTGIISGAFGRSDWVTVRYSLDGVEQWRRIEPGLGNTEDQPVDLKTDSAGNVVVVGFNETTQGGAKDIRLIKYDPQGNVIWRTNYSDTAISDEFPNELAIDAADNIYVVADRPISTNPELLTEPITLKFSPNGNLLFVLAGPGQGGSAIDLDPAGNFVVSGLYFEEGGTNLIRQTTKFTSAGSPLWSLPIAGMLAVDKVDGSTYVIDSTNLATTKVSASGQVLWQNTIPGTQAVRAITVDDVTGAFVQTGNSSSGFGDILTVRYAAGSTPPPPPPPPVPAAPSGLGLGAKKGTLTLTWNDNANNETGFLIERSVNGGSFTQIAQVGANVRTFTNSGLNKNTTYTYRVRAFNANGNSAYSNTATGSPR